MPHFLFLSGAFRTFRDSIAEVHSYNKSKVHEIVKIIRKDGTVVHCFYDTEQAFKSLDDTIPHKYDFTGSFFHEDYACAEKVGWLGLITINGVFIPALKKEYDNSQCICPVRTGLAIMEVCHDEYALLVVKGKNLNVISDSEEMAQIINDAGLIQEGLHLLTDEERKQLFKWPKDSNLMRIKSDETL